MAGVLTPAFVAVEGVIAEVQDEIRSADVAVAGSAAPAVAAGGTAARDGTAVELAALRLAAELGEIGAGVGLAWFGAEAEPAGFRVGWVAPEVGPGDCPVERDESEAGSGVPEAA